MTEAQHGKEITLEELKELELSILSSVHEICKSENLIYSLGGGTLLGAVRHQGFIPWDDDIDIMMPRPDYDAFIEYCLTHETGLKIRCFQTDKTYTDLSAKVYLPNTILEDNTSKDDGEAIGVFIDIFPIDGLGNTYKKAVKAFKATSFKRNLLVAAQWKKFFKSKTHPWYYEPFRFAFFLLSRCINRAKTFKKVLKKYENINFNEVNFAAAVGGAYREKEILPREVFTEYCLLTFENAEFCAITSYDRYLSSIYGDYMKLPPEEKRVSHHTFKAYYKD